MQVIAAWAVAEHGAQTLGDLLTLTPDVEVLPPDVSRSWDRIRQLDLRTLAGTALPDGDLPRLARDLLDEIQERRRLILISRTFALARRTYDSLAAELGVGRERVRQIEPRHCNSWPAQPRTTGTARCAGGGIGRTT